MIQCTLWPASTGDQLKLGGGNMVFDFFDLLLRVPINVRTLRRQMKAEQVDIFDDDEDEDEDDDAEDDEEAQLTMSVEISCSLWALDLLTWNWTR